MQTARDKLRELRSLHEDGLLSQQEFDSRKNAILDAEYAPGRLGMPLPRSRRGTEIGLMAGQEIGPQNRRYRLERLIALGGMGQVWQATDLATEAELGRSEAVALKILPLQLTASASRARLLIEEATRARRLAHEHIVRVYEWALDPATASYFIIMECLEGEDLDSLLAREGRLSPERAAALLAPVAAALEYAWDKHRLVHRDLKPGNLFITGAGEVKLLDFGIAAHGGEGAPTGFALQAPVAGTAGYRAPEAGAHGSEPAPSLDVYAIAVMIYQMLEARMPFYARRSANHLPPRPAALTEPQWAVLQAGFAIDPALRPPSVSALLAALRRALGPSPQELAAQAAAKRAEQAQEAQRAQHLAAQRKASAEAAAAAQALRDRQRRELQKAERAAAEAARRERKEALRKLLLERRAADAEQARLAKQEQDRGALQARAAAAYRAEQQRARAEVAARSQAAPIADPASPVAGADGVLRDAFIDGAGSGPELVFIPTGRFQMGSPEHERAIALLAGAQPSWLARETPQRWVGIEQPIALGRYPVKVGEWRRFVRASGWQRQGDTDWEAPGFRQDDDHPVVGVSWHDAQAYCRWLSEQTGQAYRLPSEAEWEYACRAGTRTALSFGDAIDPSLANYDGNFSYNGSVKGDYRKGTTRAGQFAPNPWGLFDMHGNVWEWVQDLVHDNYQGAPLTGAAWEEGGDPERRILRGGAWRYHPRYLRSALRNGLAAALGNDVAGFRVARGLA